MKTCRHLILALVPLLSAVPLVASADQRGHGGHGWHGDIRHFERHDAHMWRSGAWHHGPHGGRLGWWWVSGGLWYFYSQPVYPYPDPYTPAVVVVQQQPAPAVVVQSAPPMQSAPPAPAQPTTQYWYYCEDSRTYYPYVPTCASPWKSVPATPPAGAPQ